LVRWLTVCWAGGMATEQTGSGGEHPLPFMRGNGGGPCCHLSMVVVGPHRHSSIVVLGAGGCSWTFIAIHRSLVLGSWAWLGGAMVGVWCQLGEVL